ncbi:MAG: hypothetical protein RL404_2936 [Pseudomonadota bacterium]
MLPSHSAAQGTRWTLQRKASVIEALLNDTLSLEEAFERYALSPEELGQWWRHLQTLENIPALLDIFEA